MSRSFHHVSLWAYLRGFFIIWKKPAVKETDAHALRSEYEVVGDTLSNDAEAEGQIPHRGPNVPCALCPMYTVSSITSIYTAHHWKLSELRWYIDSTGHFLCLLLTTYSHESALKHRRGNNPRCYRMSLTTWEGNTAPAYFFFCMYAAMSVQN